MTRAVIEFGDYEFVAELDNGYVDVSAREPSEPRLKWVATLRWDPAGYFDAGQVEDCKYLAAKIGPSVAYALESILGRKMP